MTEPVHQDESAGEEDEGAALSEGEQALMLDDAVAGAGGGGEEAALLPSDDEADEPGAGAAAGEVRLHGARPSLAALTAPPSPPSTTPSARWRELRSVGCVS